MAASFYSISVCMHASAANGIAPYAGREDEQANLISGGELLLIGVSLLSSSCQTLHIGKRQFHNRLQTCCTVKGMQTAALL